MRLALTLPAVVRGPPPTLPHHCHPPLPWPAAAPLGSDNLGNTCYINSLVHLVLAVNSGLPLAAVGCDDNTCSLCSCFRQVCDAVLRRDASALHGKWVEVAGKLPKYEHTPLMCKLVDALASRGYAPGVQQDAQEVLQHLLWEAPALALRVATTTTCTACSSAYTANEPEHTLQLPLGPQRARTALAGVLLESLADPVADAPCPRCCCPGETAPREQVRRILSPPALLLLHVKRFEFTAAAGVKRSDELDWDVEGSTGPVCDLRPACKLESSDLESCSLSPDSVPLRYQPVSAVIHEGGDLARGHYYTIRRASYGSWWKVSDRVVVGLTDAEAWKLLPSAYLVFCKAAAPFPPLLRQRILDGVASRRLVGKAIASALAERWSVPGPLPDFEGDWAAPPHKAVTQALLGPLAPAEAKRVRAVFAVPEKMWGKDLVRAEWCKKAWGGWKEATGLFGSVTYREVQELRDGGWLNDSIINYWFDAVAASNVCAVREWERLGRTGPRPIAVGVLSSWYIASDKGKNHGSAETLKKRGTFDITAYDFLAA